MTRIALIVALVLLVPGASAQTNTVGDMIASLDTHEANQPVALATGRGFKAAPVRVLWGAYFLTTVGELRDALSFYQPSKPIVMMIGNNTYQVPLEVVEEVMSPDLGRSAWWDKHAARTSRTGSWPRRLSWLPA